MATLGVTEGYWTALTVVISLNPPPHHTHTHIKTDTDLVCECVFMCVA